MSVRPVIGIPWSEDNASLFENIAEDAVFNLTMNTGAILTYEFATKNDVLRSDTRIFRQVGPGLVLLLIGETDIDGLPTGTRTLISASYSAEQELSRGGELLGLNAVVQEGELGSALEMGKGISLYLQNLQTICDMPDLPAGQQALLFDLDLIADTEPLDTSLWRVELIDAGGQVYLPNTALLEYASYGTLPDEIPAFARIPS
jgi:hypothetical protein